MHNNIILQTRALQSAYPTRTLHLCCICGVVRKLQCMSDDPYQATCVHEQKTRGLQWARSMGMVMMANNYIPFVTVSNDSKHVWVNFSPLRLVHYAYNLLRCLDVEI